MALDGPLLVRHIHMTRPTSGSLESRDPPPLLVQRQSRVPSATSGLAAVARPVPQFWHGRCHVTRPHLQFHGCQVTQPHFRFGGCHMTTPTGAIGPSPPHTGST